MIAKKIKQTNIIKYKNNCIVIKIWWQFKKLQAFILKNLRWLVPWI
jgi:hypothetical protein